MIISPFSDCNNISDHLGKLQYAILQHRNAPFPLHIGIESTQLIHWKKIEWTISGRPRRQIPGQKCSTSTDSVGKICRSIAFCCPTKVPWSY